MQRVKVFLDNRPWQEALEEYREVLRRAGSLAPGRGEKQPTRTALGRVTSEPVYAVLSSPHYAGAAMDGVAVKAEDTFGASEEAPRRMRLGEEAVVVDTGDPLPPGCDAVIMLEHLNFPEEGVVEIRSPAVPWQHVRQPGEDILAGEMLLPANHRLRPVDLGLLLSAGVVEVAVYPRPRVAILPTGSELVDPNPHPLPGQILDSNSAMLAGMVQEWGGDPEVFPITPDDYDLLKARLRAALETADMVLINAGSSAGREDYTARLIAELGRVLTHGVATRPGKPAILGVIEGKPVIGIPGYPVSAALCADLFVRPLLYEKQGLPVPRRAISRAVLNRKIPSALGREDFVRLRLARIGDKLTAVPLGRGAGALTTLARADGILRIPLESEGFPAGAEVEVSLLRDLTDIEAAVLVSGSGDPLLDILGTVMRQLYPGRSLTISPVGSLGGLQALRQGEAHGASLTLWDPATGEYNVSYVEKLLAGREALLINLAYRQVGLMVAPGNPKGINDLQDLTRPDITFVNRPVGSGMRLFLDTNLERLGIKGEEIKGYDREEFTHLGVAAAVASGRADAGLGIYAAARVYGLDFLPLAAERLDLCFLRETWEEQGIRDLIQTICSREFLEEASRWRGYDLRDCGKVVWKNY
ncbi:MAG TPA: molybdopterin biosynthesis protein [Peptococcaceae bacterium]|nr:MAG: Molybdenum cofactor synthesis domain protein [Moorella sp. 60_41]HBT47754.1 molybdopterin biosynthesis protein [Peptococcaceae bacterium]